MTAKKEKQFKNCVVCKRTFIQPDGIFGKAWERRTICDKVCREVYLRTNPNYGFKTGHQGYLNSGSFKKGLQPWNKGLKVKTNNALDIFTANGGSANRGKKSSEETRNKIKQARAKQINPSGPNHWNWKGGTSELRKKLQETSIYRQWRSQIFERDNYTCLLCSKKGGKLNADHIIPYSKIISDNKIITVEEAKSCPILWDVLNGRTLCESCHQKTDTYGSKSIVRK